MLTTNNAQGYSKKALIEKCGLSSTRYYRVISDESYTMTEELRNTRDNEEAAKIRQVLEKYPNYFGFITSHNPKKIFF
ncbi:hypothetical protein [Succinimonas amylolytica]|uniref:hypothetical protein n=1 Tax=Succinimonas amylolytica TaxID=83769 RepID=UPI000368E3AC|nr:hypothetical protein [Succinimonas amylolytica]